MVQPSIDVTLKQNTTEAYTKNAQNSLSTCNEPPPMPLKHFKRFGKVSKEEWSCSDRR